MHRNHPGPSNQQSLAPLPRHQTADLSFFGYQVFKIRLENRENKGPEKPAEIG